MELILIIKGGNILNNNEVVFTKSGAHEYVFSYNQSRYIIKEKAAILQRFLGLRHYYVYCEENMTRCVGRFNMQGGRKLEIDVTKESRRLSATIYLIRLFFIIVRAFKIESIAYHYQRKEKELRLSSDDMIDEWDVLVGCFMLYQLNRIGSGDASLDGDA